MNEEDKKRFAKYFPGYIEPPTPIPHPSLEDNAIQESSNEHPTKSDKVKDTLGFVDKINVNQDDLINQVLKEIAMNK